jgi:hypothetical protein
MEGDHHMAKHEQPDQSWRAWVLKSLPIQMMAEPAAAGFEPGPANPQPFSVGMSLVPSFDVIELLPPGAADRLRALRQRFTDLNTLIPKHDVMHEASTARIIAEQRLQRLRDHQSNGGFNLKPDDPRVLEQERLLGKLNDDLRRLNELVETRSAVWHAASHVLTAVEGWLKNGVPPGVVLEDHEVEVPKLAKGESGLLDAIENRRRRGRELRADLRRIESSCYPSSYCKQRMRAMVEQLAQQGTPDVSSLVEHDRSIAFPTTRLQSSIYNVETPAAIGFAEVPDIVALFAWLHRDLLIKRLDAEIDSESDDAAALSATERETRAAVVMGDLLAVEYDEARLVWQAQADKLSCEHRSDCAAQCILQVRLVTAPRVEATGTTPGYSWDLRR